MSASVKVVDLSKVKDGGGFNKERIPEGDYLATIVKVEDAESKADKVFQYLFTIRIDSRSRSNFPYYCKLQENQLWKLRNLLIAAGKTVPKSKLKVDPNTIIGKKIGVTISDTEYEGKEQSEIDAVFPAAELPEDQPGGTPEVAEDDDAEDADEMVEDIDLEEDEEVVEDEAEEADPYADMDRTALKAELKRLDSTFQARKNQTDDDLRELLRSKAGADEPDVAEDDEDEDEAPAAKPKATAKTSTRRAAKPKAADISDEDIDEMDIDDL